MKTVKYKELSKAMHEFTKQVEAMDECMEVGLAAGDKVEISISAGIHNMSPEQAVAFAVSLSEVAEAARNFKYAGYTIVQ